MKKTIIVLILVLPVVVAALTYLLAMEIVRSITLVRVSEVRFASDEVMMAGGWFELGDNWATITNVGQVVDLREFIIIYPAQANFSDITFEVRDFGNNNAEHIASVTGGVLTVHETSFAPIHIRVMVDASPQITFELMRIDPPLN